MPNRLQNETSPYLLQHAGNPVDWYPWSSEALDRSRQEDKPIFLSIGYSACHWCHVMEHESFEDPEIADFLNSHFISIKVDREERPDLDHIYMQAVMALRGGQGGWPLSVFLTPTQHVFFGGTYWPPRQRQNMPGFLDVLKRVHEAYHTVRSQIEKQSLQITEWLNEPAPTSETALDGSLLEQSFHGIKADFDFAYGGFGTEPKFPHASTLRLLLRMAVSAPTRSSPQVDLVKVSQMVRLNLDGMRRGGIYDQLGGGFARYSVDREWLVPHFEKMLYDNALLAGVYLESFQAHRQDVDAEVAAETLDFLLREMQDPAGGLHSSLDADSEGEEGKFYVWDVEEIKQRLPETGALVAEYFGATRHGNFEGHNILYLPETPQRFATSKGLGLDHWRAILDAARHELRVARDQRIRPHKDDKIILSWNALAISAFADGARVLGSERYAEAAVQIAEFILKHLQQPGGRLLRCYRKGIAKPLAYLDDYAYFLVALLDLYQARLDERWLEEARRIAREMLELFADEQGGLLNFIGSDQDPLIARFKDQQDSSIPSGNAMAAEGLIRLGRLLGDAELQARADGLLRALSALFRRAPLAASQGLLALQWACEPPEEWVLIVAREEDRAACQALLREHWSPLVSILMRCETRPDWMRPVADPLFADRSAIRGEPTLYRCQNFTCHQPVIGFEAIRETLQAATLARRPVAGQGV